MPRFYFHLYNDETALDPEGEEMPDAAAAMDSAECMARDMAAQSVRDGRLTLSHRIEVTNADREVVGVVHFGDVVQVLGSADTR